MTSYSCTVFVTEFTEFCGSYSRLKLADMPEIRITRTIPPTTYNHLINTQKFIRDDRQNMQYS